MAQHESFDAILNREFRWPRAGDLPFTQSKDWSANAYIDRQGHGRLVLMIMGYKKAADLMVEKANEERIDRDTLIFPIMFNYRQFIELSLKHLISQYGPTVGIAANWQSHDLHFLWKVFVDVLTDYGHGAQEEADTAVASIITEFAKVDPNSFSYRYPVDRQGRPILLPSQGVDLTALSDVMKGVDGYFTGCDGYLDHLQSAGP
ncbi:hypothetical protein RPMA_02510 [Tardiphaga alba]|uniref:Uncharacterized protein n=1 Tax=Tardiphaga alba TaxID=340268 RepID=A0ABX8A2S6_9BRAD|nr:hypothetical protein [Tardiphaga alba]QUS37854.1 hypothetical protein RPMA_02510 [Tardiphaga alba]